MNYKIITIRTIKTDNYTIPAGTILIERNNVDKLCNRVKDYTEYLPWEFYGKLSNGVEIKGLKVNIPCDNIKVIYDSECSYFDLVAV